MIGYNEANNIAKENKNHYLDETRTKVVHIISKAASHGLHHTEIEIYAAAPKATPAETYDNTMVIAHELENNGFAISISLDDEDRPTLYVEWF